MQSLSQVEDSPPEFASSSVEKSSLEFWENSAINSDILTV